MRNIAILWYAFVTEAYEWTQTFDFCLPGYSQIIIKPAYILVLIQLISPSSFAIIKQRQVIELVLMEHKYLYSVITDFLPVSFFSINLQNNINLLIESHTRFACFTVTHLNYTNQNLFLSIITLRSASNVIYSKISKSCLKYDVIPRPIIHKTHPA